jgi:hypothetical protein
MLARQLHHHPAWSAAVDWRAGAARDRLELMRLMHAEKSLGCGCFPISRIKITTLASNLAVPPPRSASWDQTLMPACRRRSRRLPPRGFPVAVLMSFSTSIW